MIAMAIEEVLEECGFTSFDVAPSAHSAIAAAALRRPDIITSDVQLKPGCGISAVENISDGSAIPTVFITGNVAHVTRRLSTYRVLRKPFTEKALIAAVASAMLGVSERDARK
jgi:CheY-like chemotaxis protein